MMVEVPAFSALMRQLKGESPNIQLYSEPWGHGEHCDSDCSCLSSDRTAYVHRLLPMSWEDESTSKNDDHTSVETENNVVVDNDCGYLGVGRHQCHLYHIGQVHMAVYYWLFMCGGRRDCWCPRIGSDRWHGALGGRSFRTGGAIRTQYAVRSGPAD